MQERYLDLGVGVVSLEGVLTTHAEERRYHWWQPYYSCIVVNYVGDDDNEYEFLFPSSQSRNAAHEKLRDALRQYNSR